MTRLDSRTLAHRPLIGSSDAMSGVWEIVERVGASPWPVLVLGESGTGKELVARTLHQHRGTGPFVVIDCSAMVGPLMESELFGHVRGAFTGAVGAKPGLIELANGGTAFFDEIGELAIDLQAKLLRVIQEKEFRPVGAVTTRRSDFRIVAATNRDLIAEVGKGSFRQDLYYRLKVITLRLPPLRERREDLTELTDFFLQRYGPSYTLTAEVRQALCEYEWPGNVRELENCVQHMIGTSRDPIIGLDDLPTALLNDLLAKKNDVLTMAKAVGTATHHPEPPRQAFTPVPGHIIPLPELERRAIIEAMEFTRGDRTTAAVLLGIGRTTLYRKLKQYGLDRGKGHFGKL